MEFATIRDPLTLKSFHSSVQEASECIRKLKDFRVTEPCLAYAKHEQYLIVTTDISSTAIRAVLFQMKVTALNN